MPDLGSSSTFFFLSFFGSEKCSESVTVVEFGQSDHWLTFQYKVIHWYSCGHRDLISRSRKCVENTKLKVLFSCSSFTPQTFMMVACMEARSHTRTQAHMCTHAFTVLMTVAFKSKFSNVGTLPTLTEEVRSFKLCIVLFIITSPTPFWSSVCFVFASCSDDPKEK